MPQVFKGAISFGLIHIPITLHKVISSTKLSFNLLDKKTMKRIKYQKKTEDSEKEVDSKNVIKGYKYQDDQYIVLTDEDFKKIRPSKDQNIEVEHFTEIADIDPICFNKSYYVAPSKSAIRAYHLFKESLSKTKKVAIARIFIRNNEELAILKVSDNILYLITLYYYEEINPAPAEEEKVVLSRQEANLAINLIDSMSKKFQHKEYNNKYNEDLKKLIDAKVKGKKVTIKKEKINNQALDLMVALEKSLKSNTGRGLRG